MAEVTSLIGTLGWPIVCCLIMMKYVAHQDDKRTEERKQEREAHQKEMEAITNAINANTIVLESLKEKLGGIA